MKVIIYTDGGSRGNPGPAAAGYVIYDEQMRVLHQEGVFLGINTNNFAEYTALVLALKKARDLKAMQVDIRMDSELIVRQMKGVYKIKHPPLQLLAGEAEDVLEFFDAYTFTHVPREQNKVADKMVNQALDANA